MTVKRKTDPNHKAHFLFAVKCVCSCNWESAHWYGKGAKRNATAEWHSHRDKCERKDSDEVRSLQCA